MRKLFLMASLLICLTGVNVFAQETTPAQKPATDAEQPKSAVDRALEEAKKRGEVVLVRCLEKCGEDEKIEDDVEVGRALEMPKPAYPELARRAHASGEVQVQLIIDVDGTVIAAAAISGHPLLQATSVAAARQTRFSPTKVKGEPVKVTGVITYHFISH